MYLVTWIPHCCQSYGTVEGWFWGDIVLGLLIVPKCEAITSNFRIVLVRDRGCFREDAIFVRVASREMQLENVPIFLCLHAEGERVAGWAFEERVVSLSSAAQAAWSKPWL